MSRPSEGPEIIRPFGPAEDRERVTSDYLKQLQLTKQLEQRAKEAAKNRKAAEEKISEVEASLKRAKEMKIDTLEADRLLVESTSAYAKRDYSTALSQAVGAIASLSVSIKERSTSILGSVTTLLEMVRPDKETEEAFGSAAASKALLSEGRAVEALAKAKVAWDMADQKVNKSISEMFGRAQTSILLAERSKIAVTAKKQMLVKARSFMDGGDRKAALEKLTSLLDSLKLSFTKQFGARAMNIRALLADAGLEDDVIAHVNGEMTGPYHYWTRTPSKRSRSSIGPRKRPSRRWPTGRSHGRPMSTGGPPPSRRWGPTPPWSERSSRPPWARPRGGRSARR